MAESNTQPSPGAVFTPGNHDGVHLGHRALVRTARTLADARGLRVTALTFDPHPTSFFAPERAPVPLTTMERRRELLLGAGADDVLVLPFDLALATLAPDAFIEGLIARGARGFVVGPDFRFGKDRAGDIEVLQRYGASHGMVVEVEPPVMLDGERVSSSGVRAAVSRGEVEHAARMLGRVHELQGRVVQGNQRGRTLGFPTANLATGSVLHPADGVYAVIARVLTEPSGATGTEGAPGQAAAGEPLLGIMNLGVRPTLAAGRSVEVHLFDFDADLYGAELRVGLVGRVRAERKFDSLDALRRQIDLDCQSARDTLAAARAEGLAPQGRWAWI